MSDDRGAGGDRFGFEGRVALVTGGASGIGRATALRFAGAGASVVVADRDPAGALGTVEAIEAGGASATAVEVDVTDRAGVAAMVRVAAETYGGLDAAVNAAGVPHAFTGLEELSLEDWTHTLAVNLTGVFLCLQAELPLLRTRRGAVVNVASVAGQVGVANLAAYSASKHGVIGLTRSVALEEARRGVRVNAVCPGTIRTPLLDGFAPNPEVVARMGTMAPMRRLGTPEEVAEAAVWLCSPAASFVTGQALGVDGGVLAT